MNVEEIVAASSKLTTFPTDLVARVSTQKPYPSPGRGERVVLIDLRHETWYFTRIK